MQIGMTRRMLDCLSFIELRWQEETIPPTFDEIKIHLGLKSKSGVARLIDSLVERGAIVRLPGRARALMPTRQRHIAILLPPTVEQRLRLIAAQTKQTPENFVTKLIMEKISIPADRAPTARRPTTPTLNHREDRAATTEAVVKN